MCFFFRPVYFIGETACSRMKFIIRVFNGSWSCHPDIWLAHPSIIMYTFNEFCF
jgi:hypothetical protein